VIRARDGLRHGPDAAADHERVENAERSERLRTQLQPGDQNRQQENREIDREPEVARREPFRRDGVAALRLRADAAAQRLERAPVKRAERGDRAPNREEHPEQAELEEVREYDDLGRE
jgi:hypothetical protein